MSDKPEAYKYTGQETGRPTAYRPEFCERIRDMAREGKTPVEWADQLDVARSTLDNWCEIIPEFSEAYSRARESCQAWWIQQGRKGVFHGKEFNDRQWKTMVYNLFRDDWQDERSINISGTVVHLTQDQLARLPDHLIARIADGEPAEVVLASVADDVLGRLLSGEDVEEDGAVEEADYELVDEPPASEETEG